MSKTKEERLLSMAVDLVSAFLSGNKSSEMKTAFGIGANGTVMDAVDATYARLQELMTKQRSNS